MGKHNRKSRDPRMLREAAKQRSDKAIEREAYWFRHANEVPPGSTVYDPEDDITTQLPGTWGEGH